MPVSKNGGQTIITTSQSTQKYLEVARRPFQVYLQFGVGKANKTRPRVTVNYVRGLQNTRDKPRQQQLLSDAGVRVPQYFGKTYYNAIDYLRDSGTPIVGKRLKHSRGRGIKLFDDPDELERFAQRNRGRYYYQTYHDMNREWRIHVSAYHDEPVCYYRKCLRGEIVEQWREEEIEKPWVRNLENCYFKLHSAEDRESWFDDMVAECKRAIEILDMDIAGVDIGENNKTDGGDFVIYEVNSCCGMEENTREAYEQALEDIIDIKARNKGLI